MVSRKIGETITAKGKEKADGSVRFQKPEKFGTRNKQLAAQGAAHFQFAALNEPIDAEIIHAKQVGGFLDGISEPFGLRWLGRFGSVRGRGKRRASGGSLRAVLGSL